MNTKEVTLDVVRQWVKEENVTAMSLLDSNYDAPEVLERIYKDKTGNKLSPTALIHFMRHLKTLSKEA